MADREDELVLKAKAQDAGAKALLESLQKAIKDLDAAREADDKAAKKSAQQQITLLRSIIKEWADVEREVEKSAKRKADAEARAARDIAAKEKALTKLKAAEERNRRKETEASDKAAIKSAQAAAKARIAIVKETIRTAKQAVAINEQQAKNADKEAKARAAAELKASKDTLNTARAIAREKAKIARQEEKELRTAAAARAKVLRDEAKLAASTARQQTQAARQQAQAARQQAQAQAQAARQQAQAQRQAAQQALATQRNALNAHKTQLGIIGSSTTALTRQILALAAAYAGFRQIQNFISLGLRFNQTIESSKLGIAALITAEGRLTDVSGKAIEGQAGLEAALALAGDQVRKLRIAGIQTAATTEQLVDAYQQAVGAGLKVGLTLDQIRVFTIRAVQAAFALGIPMNQLNQEVRSILDGTIDRNSRVAKALQLSNQEVRLAKEQGRLAQFLDERFKSFELTGEKAITTFAVLRNNMQEALAVFAGDATKPLFESIRVTGLKALQTLFDFNTAQIASKFRGLVEGIQQIFAIVGQVLADGIEAAVQKAQELSEWFKRNKAAVQEITEAFGQLLREVGLLLFQIITFPARLAGMATEAGGLAEVFRLIAAFTKAIRENIDFILASLAGIAIGGGISAVIAGGPVSIIIASMITLLTLINLITDRERQLSLDQARRIELLGAENARIIKLAGSYSQVVRSLKGVKEGTQEYATKQLELKGIQDELIRTGGPFADILKKQGDNAEEAARQMLLLAKQTGINTALQLVGAEQEVDLLNEKKFNLRKEIDQLTKELAGRAPVPDSKLREIEAVSTQIEIAEARVKALTRALAQSAEALREAEAAATVVGVGGARPVGKGRGTLNDAAQLQEGILKLIKERVKTETVIIEGQFERLEITAKEKIKAIAALQNSVIEAEITLRRKRIEGTTDEGEKDKNLEEIRAFEEERVRIGEQANNDITESNKENFKIRSQIMADFFEATGQTAVAAAERLGNQYNEALIRALREGDDDLRRAIIKLIDIGTAKARVEELNKLVSKSESALTAKLQRISGQLETGVLTDTEARREQSAAYGEFLSVLKTVVPQMEAFRDTLGPVDPEFEAMLQALISKMEEAGFKVKQFKDEWFQAGKDINQAIANDLGNAMADIVTGTQSVAQAFASMTTSILSDIAHIISQMIALKIVEGALGASIFSVGMKEGGLVNFADGGLVRGSGSGTSDSIPARLSNNEFVMTARAVQKFSPEFFEALNASAGHRPVRRSGLRFASGGLVTSTGGSSTSLDSRIALGLDEGLVLKKLESSAGQRVLLRTIAKNRKAVTRVLQG